jgi:hypothetical protein
LKCYLRGDLLLLQDLCCLHWSPWLKQCLVSNGEINQSSVSKPNCLLCEIRCCVVWYRTDFDVLTKQPLLALMRVTFLSFLSLPLNGFFSFKGKKYNLILPLFYRCVCPVSPFLLSKCVTGLYEIWCKHHVIAAIGVACGQWGGGEGGAREANGPQIFFLPK